MSRRERKNLIRIVVALAAFAAIFIADKAVGLADVFGGRYGWLFPFALYLAVYLLIGYDVLWRAVRNIAHGQVFDENFLMCIATLGAFALAIYRGAAGMEIEGFDEACAVLLFYQVGEWFQSYATGKSRKSISALMDIRPDYANVLRGEEAETVDPSEVAVGEIILVNPGEKIPLDGVVTEGASSLDTKALTGESLPRDVAEGAEVISGSVNLTSQIKIRVEKEFYDSTVSKILDLVENASEQKSRAENFITRFAKYYTPAVVVTALLLAVIPGAVTGDWSTWIYRALSFLVVSCPCALVISVPLSFFAGIGAASKCGILVKGSNYLEKFDKAKTFVFDKTGTLTKGNFAVAAAVPEENGDEILRLAAIAERDSDHPIARSIAEKYGKKTEGGYTLTNVAGEGVVAEKGSDTILCGNEKLMERYGIACADPDATGTVVHVAHCGAYKGYLVIEDEVKPEAAGVIAELNAMGCRTVMLTGDNERVAAAVAKKTGVTEHRSSLLPQNKVGEVERLLSEKKRSEALCFVGDGINDAPVLMRSDIGIAMGGVGSDAAIEASDVVLMQDDLRGIPTAKRIARKTMAIVLQNIVFALAVKAVILVLSAFGITNMWAAVFGDVGVAVLAILNAMRAGRAAKSDR
ncbi:MAG TPA: cadmium-translocating P-type ATPase [Candidatus Ornithoclostridium excrementipullorum]|nr:cadmium-translocating P-type ATPase [Candidatus Ornithoclostridium excrementipullorum]